ncbi:MAG: response regulator [Methylococcales bacterium]
MTKKILYVEDETDIQTIAQIALETVGGFIVKICSSGEQALREVTGFAPDIILLDVMMPGLNGIQTLKQLQQKPECAAIPTVFMTARVQAAEVEHYLNLGAIDVIAKPFDPMTLADKVRTILNSSAINAKQDQLKRQLHALKAQYKQELPAKIADVMADWQQLKIHSAEQPLKNLIRKLHSLCGSGATFEFPALSEAAECLEKQLRVISTDLTKPLPLQALEALFANLESTASHTYTPPTNSLPCLPITRQISKKCPGVLIICDDHTNTGEMSNQLSQFAIHTETALSVADLLNKIQRSAPDVILIESSISSGLHASIDKIKQIKAELVEPPTLIVVSTDDSMHSRLSAVRAGAVAYFLSPVKMTELVDFIRSQQRIYQDPAYRIMIVDDDVHLASHTALILEQAGMETCVINEPMKVLEALAAFQPELILMDMLMPDCSGLELAAVIRQHCNYTGIAIVFFSVENDIDRHLDALRAGGDEFIVKSLSPARFLANVEVRVKRSRTIQRLMLRDGLTGLLNRSSMDEYLYLEVSKIKRQAGCFSYVILDLDHFKSVNDRFGHLAGDEVLKSLGLLLVQRLRAIDMAGRYGGEEFTIILPGTDALKAEQLLKELLQTFSAFKFTGNNHEFFVTFSAGIAEYPTFNNITTLIEAADQALYQAKAKGRNQVRVAVTGQKP